MAQRVIVGSLFAVAGLTLFGLSSEASAATILNTANGHPFISGSSGEAIADVPGGTVQSLAIQFTLSSPGTIQSVQAYIYQVTGSSSLTLGIMNNTASGLPSGTFITGDSFMATPGAGPVDQFSLSWSLAAGTYWLAGVAVLDSSLTWQTFGGLIGNYAVGDGTGSAGSWALTPGGETVFVKPMAIIAGEITSTATPLPAALPLFATGLGGLGLLGWRRKRKARAVA